MVPYWKALYETKPRLWGEDEDPPCVQALAILPGFALLYVERSMYVGTLK